MKKLLGIVVLGLLWCNVAFSKIEKRVTAYADDGVEAWFTFAYSSNDIFSLSFAGSGPLPGIMIMEGPFLDPNKAICLLLTNDPDRKLHNLIKTKFMPNYQVGGTIDVDPKNTMSAVKGKISNTVLYYFLRAAQDSKNTEDYLKNINCK
tara:strand:+ start:375 stop:821 length:447 start_codon:yes stop_codon:yes gene_type:complete